MQTYKNKIINDQWILKKKISEGSFGVVYLGEDLNTKQQVAVKIELPENEEVQSFDRELEIFQALDGVKGIPKLYYSSLQKNKENIMVIELLGKDLAYYQKQMQTFSLQTICEIGVQMITILENIHKNRVIHRDLKPENLITSFDINDKQIYLIDFGISKIYKNKNDRHIKFCTDKSFIGTSRYASTNAHFGYEISRRDDLESLMYVLLFLNKGKLPWQNMYELQDEQRIKAVGEMKKNILPQNLCCDLPDQFSNYLIYSKALEFKSIPDYNFLKNLFQEVLQDLQNKNKSLQTEYEWVIRYKEKRKSHKQKMKSIKLDSNDLNQVIDDQAMSLLEPKDKQFNKSQTLNQKNVRNMNAIKNNSLINNLQVPQEIEISGGSQYSYQSSFQQSQQEVQHSHQVNASNIDITSEQQFDEFDFDNDIMVPEQNMNFLQLGNSTSEFEFKMQGTDKKVVSQLSQGTNVTDSNFKQNINEYEINQLTLQYKLENIKKNGVKPRMKPSLIEQKKYND